jgi:hypothetical protein
MAEPAASLTRTNAFESFQDIIIKDIGVERAANEASRLSVLQLTSTMSAAFSLIWSYSAFHLASAAFLLIGIQVCSKGGIAAFLVRETERSEIVPSDDVRSAAKKGFAKLLIRAPFVLVGAAIELMRAIVIVAIQSIEPPGPLRPRRKRRSRASLGCRLNGRVG